MATIAQALKMGWELHQKGALRQAEQIYRQILQKDPRHAESWYLLGAVCQGLGRVDDAVASYRQAIRFRSSHAEAHNNLGVALGDQGQHAEAETVLHKAVRIKPSFAEAHNNLSLALMRQGKLDLALASCRRAIKHKPIYPEAHNNLGLVLMRRGQTAEAIQSYQQALRYRPNFPEAHNNLGMALAASGKLDEALARYQEALRLRPHYPEALSNLGNVLAEQGKLDEALSAYEQALQANPQYAEAWNNRGRALAKLGRVEEAMADYRQAARLKPDFAEPHSNLGVALLEQGQVDEAEGCFREALRLNPRLVEAQNNLGNVYLERGQFDQAMACYQEALRLQPDFAEAYNNLGNVLPRQGKTDEAVASYRQALQLNPNYAEAHANLAAALLRLGQIDEAIASCRRALAVRPHAEAFTNLGAAQVKLGQFTEAMASYEQALTLQPDSAQAHFNRALTLLAQGRLAEGWPEYEWRWRIRKEFEPRFFPQPRWDGSSLRGRTILLYAEQGLGDTIHFIRYGAVLKRHGATVFAECPPALLPLLARTPGIDRWIPSGTPLPDFDFHLPLLSLPGVLGTTLETTLAEVPYVFPEPRLEERWQKEIGAIAGFKIGIGWQGNPKHREDSLRSMPLKRFLPLGQITGVQLISLQKGFGTEQLRDLGERPSVIDLGSRLDEEAGAFMDTAAVLKCLDLVITSDTALAHLAGAMGIPVWVALAFVPDWRWLLERPDSPWYPTMRLFRQTRPGDWEEVFRRIAAALEGGRRKAEGGKRKAEAISVPPSSFLLHPCEVEIAAGELIDKITILEIKNTRITDPAKVRNVRHELAVLIAVRDETLAFLACRPHPPAGTGARLDAVTVELRKVNETLWDIEDEIRDCERRGDFGPRFIELARSVYCQNDRRAVLKRQINDLLGSTLIEEKSYAAY